MFSAAHRALTLNFMASSPESEMYPNNKSQDFCSIWLCKSNSLQNLGPPTMLFLLHICSNQITASFYKLNVTEMTENII